MEYKIIFVILNFVLLSLCESTLSFNSSNISEFNSTNSTNLNLVLKDYFNETNGFKFKRIYSMEDLRTTSFPHLISNDIDMDFKSGKY